MNRRKFVLSTSAGFALLGNQALAQRSRSSTSSILTSELTGGEIDISGTSLEMVNQHIDDADGSEHFHFAVEDGGQFDIILWPQDTGDAADFVNMQLEMFLAIMPDAEALGEDTFEDGGWVAFNVGNIGYYEYQLGAYPGHDLVILFNAPAEAFESTMEQAQAVLVDGLPPFLFTEESDILAVAATAASSSTTTSSRTGRGSSNTEETNSRSSRTSSSGTTAATEESGGSRTSSRSSSSNGGDPVAAVQDHRSEFLASYDDFYALLQSAAEDTTTDSELEEAFTDMVSIAQEWQAYPDQAAQVQFSAEQADLEEVYLEWADLVGELGFAFEDFYMNVGTVDDFLAVYEDWQGVDTELTAILRSAGAGFQQQAKGSPSVARAFHLPDRVA